MACCGCENYAKRISNVYRDEEIKEQFEMLIGYEVTSDSFICDACLTKLQDLITFRDQCRRIHEKHYPDAKVRITEIPSESINIIVEEIRNPTSYEDIDQSLNEQNYATEESQFSIIESVAETKKRSSGRKRKAIIEPSEVFQSTLKGEEKREGTVMIFDPNDDNDESDIFFEITEDKSKKSRKSWTQAQKLEIVEYAEENSNRQAARHYQLNESTVRCFRRQKEQLKVMPSNRSTNRHGTVYWPELELKLKNWVNEQPSTPKISDIQKKAIELADDMKIEKFSGSTSYIFKFMTRNGINSSSPRPRKNVKMEKVDESEIVEEELAKEDEMTS